MLKLEKLFKDMEDLKNSILIKKSVSIQDLFI